MAESQKKSKGKPKYNYKSDDILSPREYKAAHSAAFIISVLFFQIDSDRT